MVAAEEEVGEVVVEAAEVEAAEGVVRLKNGKFCNTARSP